MKFLRAAVIDTSALVSALVSNFDFNRDERRLGRMVLTAGLKEPLHLESARKQFLRFLEAIPAKLTTSHVIAEAYRLHRIGDFRGPKLLDFRKLSTDLLLDWNVREEHVRLTDLCQSLELRERIPRLGPTDVALIWLAQQHNCPLITEDEPLAFEGPRLGIECLLVKNLPIRA